LAPASVGLTPSAENAAKEISPAMIFSAAYWARFRLGMP
jgi:hypothetical protein